LLLLIVLTVVGGMRSERSIKAIQDNFLRSAKSQKLKKSCNCRAFLLGTGLKLTTATVLPHFPEPA
jgi:hypothetical protein